MRELKSLSHVHLAMIELALAGETNRDISAATGMTESTVSIIMRTGLFQDELARRRLELQRQLDGACAGTVNAARVSLEKAALAAAETHIKLLSSLDPKVQQVSATEILKRTYDKKYLIGENGQPTININLGPEGLLNLQIALKESLELEGRTFLTKQPSQTPPPDRLLEHARSGDADNSLSEASLGNDDSKPKASSTADSLTQKQSQQAA